MKNYLLLLLTLLFFMPIACKKKSSAGTGGNANLKINALHHATSIDSCTIYIKFNTLDAPSDGVYDLTQKLVKDSNGNSFTIFSGLKKGDYYIYGFGWDPFISENVKGGIPYTISNETDFNITVPVTETH